MGRSRGFRTYAGLVLAAFLFSAAVSAAGQRVVIEGILARVNDRIITTSDFRKRLQEELDQRTKALPPDQLRRFAKDLFQSMVEEAVLLERAKEKGFKVDKKDLDKAIKALRERNRLTDDRAFKEALKSSGLTEALLRERYRQNMLAQRVVQSELKPEEITSEELRVEYEKDKEQFRTPEKVKLEQLFFPVAEDGSDREAVLRRVRGVVARVRKGADLKAEATLAGVEVQDLGEIPVGDLRDAVRNALKGLKAGDITDPVSTAGGFQVVRLTARIPAGYVPFEKVKEQIRRKLSRDRFRKKTEAMVNNLKKQYLVEVHEDLLKKVLEGGIGG